jgi:hypothetical protein
MNWITDLRPKVDTGLLMAARTSQALAIVSLDSALGLAARSRVVPVQLLKRLNSDIGKRLVGDPAAFLDESYDVTQRLLDVHREFAQRLFEVLDPRPDVNTKAPEPSLGRVLPFPARVAHSGR